MSGRSGRRREPRRITPFCDKGVQSDDGFRVDAAVSRLNSHIASLVDERDIELSASLTRSQVVNSVTETAAKATVEDIEYVQDPRQDAAILTSCTEADVPTFEHIPSTCEYLFLCYS